MLLNFIAIKWYQQKFLIFREVDFHAMQSLISHYLPCVAIRLIFFTFLLSFVYIPLPKWKFNKQVLNCDIVHNYRFFIDSKVDNSISRIRLKYLAISELVKHYILFAWLFVLCSSFHYVCTSFAKHQILKPSAPWNNDFNSP